MKFNGTSGRQDSHDIKSIILFVWCSGLLAVLCSYDACNAKMSVIADDPSKMAMSDVTSTSRASSYDLRITVLDFASTIKTIGIVCFFIAVCVFFTLKHSGKLISTIYNVLCKFQDRSIILSNCNICCKFTKTIYSEKEYTIAKWEKTTKCHGGEVNKFQQYSWRTTSNSVRETQNCVQKELIFGTLVLRNSYKLQTNSKSQPLPCARSFFAISYVIYMDYIPIVYRNQEESYKSIYFIPGERNKSRRRTNERTNVRISSSPEFERFLFNLKRTKLFYSYALQIYC